MARSALSSLASLDLVVVVGPGDEAALLARELQLTRARVRRIWPMPDRLIARADVLFVEYLPGLLERLPWLPGEASAALVVLMPSSSIELEELRDCCPDALLYRPFTAQAVLATLVIAQSQFAYCRRLRTKNERLEENLRAIRNIERAKTILMNTRRMAEDEAYHFLRRQAMDRRVSLGQLAQTLVDSHELLG